MEWRPRLWIAIVLAIFIQPLAMLYLMRVGWAIIYFLATISVTVLEMYLNSNTNGAWLNYFSFNYLIILICIIHVSRITRRADFTTSRPWYSHWYGLVSIFLLPYVGILVTRIFFYEPFRVPSGSMLPTFPIDSYIIVSKWGYGNYRLFGMKVLSAPMFRTIQRGDVIVFQYPENPAIDYLKRVEGLPGDTVEYKDKKLFVNGVAAKYTQVGKQGKYLVLRETLGDNQNLIQIAPQYSTQVDVKYSVPPGTYFVLGDSRDNSRDSRYWGFVPQRNIIGKVIYRLNN